jgi:hypothetical protein
VFVKWRHGREHLIHVELQFLCALLTEVARDVTFVVCVLLDNTGRGGSLDKDGQVVCEASIATTEGGKVCAVVGTTTVQNPVKLCKALTEHEEIIKLTRGRKCLFCSTLFTVSQSVSVY